MHKRIFLRVATWLTLALTGGLLVSWAWNNSVSAILDLPQIHFREALGLIVLTLCFSVLARSPRKFGKHYGGEES